MWQLQEVKLGLILGNLQHDLVVHRRLDVALGATAQQSASIGQSNCGAMSTWQVDALGAERAHRFLARSYCARTKRGVSVRNMCYCEDRVCGLSCAVFTEKS